MSGFWEEDISSYLTICDKKYTKATQIYEQKNLSLSTVREIDNLSETKMLITIKITSKDEEWSSLSLQERKDAIRNRFEIIKAEYNKVRNLFNDSNNVLNVIGMDEREVEEPYECTLFVLTENANSLENNYYSDQNATFFLGDFFLFAIKLCRIMEQLMNIGVYHRGLCPRLVFENKSGLYGIGNICSQRRGPEKAAHYEYRERSYIAPELFYPAENYEIIHFEKTDEKTEIYSLGAIFYEILDHKHILFQEDASDLREVETRRLNGETPSIPDTGTIRLGECIRKACSDSDQRYNTIKEFRAELENIYRCIPVEKRNETIFESMYDDTQIEYLPQNPKSQDIIIIEDDNTKKGGEPKGISQFQKESEKSKTERKKKIEKEEKERIRLEAQAEKEKAKYRTLTEEELKEREKKLKLLIGGCLGIIVAIILSFVLLNYNASEKEIYNLTKQKNYGLAAEKIVRLSEKGKNVDEVSKDYIDACIKDHTTKNIPMIVSVLSDDVQSDYYKSVLYSLESTNQISTCTRVIQVLEEKGIYIDGYSN